MQTILCSEVASSITDIYQQTQEENTTSLRKMTQLSFQKTVATFFKLCRLFMKNKHVHSSLPLHPVTLLPFIQFGSILSIFPILPVMLNLHVLPILAVLTNLKNLLDFSIFLIHPFCQGPKNLRCYGSSCGIPAAVCDNSHMLIICICLYNPTNKSDYFVRLD